MHEIDLHVPFDAIEALGFDLAVEAFRGADLRDITLVSCGERGSLAVITYSEPVDAGFADSEAIEWWERIDRRGPDATYLCRATAPDLPEEIPSGRERILEAQAVTVEDDGCTVTFVGRREALQCDGEVTGGSDSPFSLRRLTDYTGPRGELDALTRRQREVLETAYDLGYFEVPREATAEEIARRLGVERATVSEHLQRAERNLLSSLLTD